MAITQLKDGRWMVYYRKGKKLKKEYFGRGLRKYTAAVKRNKELGFQPPKSSTKWNRRIIDLLVDKYGEGAISFEIVSEVGRIDALTSNEIIEIKPVNAWKAALGQVLAYGFYIPDRNLRLYLFGSVSKKYHKTIVRICRKYGVKVSFYGDME